MRSQASLYTVFVLAFFAAPSVIHAQHGAGGGMPGQNGGGFPSVNVGGYKDHEPVVHDRHIQGTVSDANGKAVSGAIVYMKNLKNNTVASAFVDDKGEYRFGALDKNADYKIWAQVDKKQGPTKTISQYDTRDELSLNLKVE